MSLYARRLGLAALLALPLCRSGLRGRRRAGHAAGRRVHAPGRGAAPGAARAARAGLRSSSSRVPDRPGVAGVRAAQRALAAAGAAERRAAQVALPRRLIDYPWLSAYVARAASGRPELERPARTAVAWRREQLRGGAAVAPGRDRCLPPGLEGAGYRITGRRSRRCSCCLGARSRAGQRASPRPAAVRRPHLVPPRAVAPRRPASAGRPAVPRLQEGAPGPSALGVVITREWTGCHSWACGDRRAQLRDRVLLASLGRRRDPKACMA